MNIEGLNGLPLQQTGSQARKAEKQGTSEGSSKQEAIDKFIKSDNFDKNDISPETATKISQAQPDMRQERIEAVRERLFTGFYAQKQFDLRLSEKLADLM